MCDDEKKIKYYVVGVAVVDVVVAIADIAVMVLLAACDENVVRPTKLLPKFYFLCKCNIPISDFFFLFAGRQKNRPSKKKIYVKIKYGNLTCAGIMYIDDDIVCSICVCVCA